MIYNMTPPTFFPDQVSILMDPGSMFAIITNCYIQGPSKCRNCLKTDPTGEHIVPIDLLAGGEGAGCVLLALANRTQNDI